MLAITKARWQAKVLNFKGKQYIGFFVCNLHSVTKYKVYHYLSSQMLLPTPSFSKFTLHIRKWAIIDSSLWKQKDGKCS